MLLSFLVYTVTAAMLAYLGWHVSNREQRLLSADGNVLPFYSWEIIASIVVFAVVAGARYKTGYDHVAYYSQYVQLRDLGNFSRNDYEIGFVLISKVFAYFKVHEFFYFAFWGALQLGLFYFTFRKNKSLLPWVALIVMLGGYFVGWMNSIRQVIVECGFIALVTCCSSGKRTLAACAVSLLLATIHKSAFLIPVFLGVMWLMRNVDLSRKSSLIIFISCVFLGVYPIWLTVFSGLSDILENTSLQKYIPMLDDITAGAFRITKWGPNHVLVVLSQLMMLWFYPKVKENNKDDVHLKSFFNLSLMGMCLGSLFINSSHFLLRPIEYLTLCTVVLGGYTLRTLYVEKNRVMFALFALTTLTITYIAVIKAVYVPTEINTPFLYNILFFKS